MVSFALVICSALLGVLVFQRSDAQSLESLIKDVYQSENKIPTVTSSPHSATAGDSKCLCVPYYQCNNNTINTSGVGLIDIRIHEAECEDYLETCCNPPDVVDKPITKAPPVVRPSGCGRRNPDGVGFRITGDNDNEAQFGEFPWMVAVLLEESVEGNPNNLNVYQCGGALIHPHVVLTAAHCVTGKDKKFKIRAGEWDTQTKNELFDNQDRHVKSVVVHPQFYSGALYNDVALMFLEEPVTLAENVDVVCLPEQNYVFDHSRCFASGWGKDVFGKEGKYQVILKKIDLPIVDRESCQTKLRTTRLGKFFELHKSFICAGGETGKDTCKGDGGSPLVCPIPDHPGRYMQGGIVAWGIGCGENNVPGVYVNIAMFRDWINDQMVYNNFDTTSYKL